MPYEEQQLEAIYGPEAKFSDHKRGQIIAYLAYSGQPRRGEIIWVCAAGQALVSGKEMPVHYIVSSGHGWPEIVYPGEVIQDTDDEPALAHCPYCGSLHPAEAIEHCPSNPKNRRK